MTSYDTPRMPDAGAPPARHRHADAWAHNARVGLILFLIYLALYVGFILLSAFGGKAMATPMIGGVNLAIVYGFGLIVSAFALAVVYMFLCHAETETRPESSEAEISRKALEEEGSA